MTGMIDPPLDVIATPDIHIVITRIDPGSVVPSPTPVTIDRGVAAARTPIEAAPGHSTVSTQFLMPQKLKFLPLPLQHTTLQTFIS